MLPLYCHIPASKTSYESLFQIRVNMPLIVSVHHIQAYETGYESSACCKTIRMAVQLFVLTSWEFKWGLMKLCGICRLHDHQSLTNYRCLTVDMTLISRCGTYWNWIWHPCSRSSWVLPIHPQFRVVGVLEPILATIGQAMITNI